MRLALVILGALLVVIPRTSLAQTVKRPPEDARILVDVNVYGSAESLAKDREFQSRFLVFSEAGSAFASYPKPSRANTFLDVGGSVMLNRWWGGGVNYSRTSREDVVGLKATVPHPTFFAAAVTNTGVTAQPLTRTEGATNFFVALMPIRTNRVEWRLVAGPTIFSLKANMVSDVLYAQTYSPSSPQQTITITGFTASQVKASKLGFHAGTDFTYFLTKIVGVGVGMRISDGIITLEEEPLSKITQQIRVGGTQVFLGLRLRLDR
jgi:hypothetical protein